MSLTADFQNRHLHQRAKSLRKPHRQCKTRRRRSCGEATPVLLPSDVLVRELPPRHSLSGTDCSFSAGDIHHNEPFFLIWRGTDDTFKAVTQQVRSGKFLEVSAAVLAFVLLWSFAPERKRPRRLPPLLGKRGGGDAGVNAFCLPVAAPPPRSLSPCFACDLSADSPGVAAA